MDIIKYEIIIYIYKKENLGTDKYKDFHVNMKSELEWFPKIREYQQFPINIYK